jgi:hypothetical protein
LIENETRVWDRDSDLSLEEKKRGNTRGNSSWVMWSAFRVAAALRTPQFTLLHSLIFSFSAGDATSLGPRHPCRKLTGQARGKARHGCIHGAPSI